AIRLGQQGIKTLVVDKATFPSLPAVASSPIIYPQHIEELADLGIPESDLFNPDGRMDNFALNFVGHFTALFAMRDAGTKIPYAYGADRVKFDNAIREHASKYESVTMRS